MPGPRALAAWPVTARRLATGLLLGVTLFIGACTQLPMHTADESTVTWAEIAALPLPPPGRRVAYGSDPEQFGELRLPAGDGPHPVVVVLHGGCWQSAYDLEHISHVSAALARSGFGTWTVEYRRIGHAGGGWTGTFDDVIRGTDFVQTLAEDASLDLDRGVVLLGHSAGGHLALWLAARRNQPGAEPFAAGPALAIRGVVSLAGITDLQDYAAGDGSCNAAVEPLLGGSFAAVPARYALASPIEQVPLGVPLRLLHGRLDSIVPFEQSERFAARARAGGDDARVEGLDGAGHFDLIAPFAPAWSAVDNAVHALFLAP